MRAHVLDPVWRLAADLSGLGLGLLVERWRTCLILPGVLGLGQWLAMIYPVLVSQLANGKPSRLGTRLPPRQSVLWRIFLVPGRVTVNVSGMADTIQT